MFKVDVYAYDLPFSRPFQGISSRKGLILKLTDEDGGVGFGEVAPFPGRSKESLDDVISALQKMSDNISDTVQYPSLAFGFETAYLTLMSATKPSRINEAVISNACTRLPINALLYGDDEHALHLFETAKAQGIRTFKIKVGGRSVDDDVHFVRRVAELLPDGGQLRLDANGVWSVSEAISFSLGVQGFPIEYLEDPTSNYQDWKRISEAVSIPLAIDECWGQNFSFDFFELDFVNTIIIKPTLYGDIAGSLNLASTLVRLGKNIVFTSTFESDFACLVIAHLASTISPTLAHGVYTPHLFNRSLLKSPMVVEDGFLDLTTRWDIELSRLIKLDL